MSILPLAAVLALSVQGQANHIESFEFLFKTNGLPIPITLTRDTPWQESVIIETLIEHGLQKRYPEEMRGVLIKDGKILISIALEQGINQDQRTATAKETIKADLTVLHPSVVVEVSVSLYTRFDQTSTVAIGTLKPHLVVKGRPDLEAVWSAVINSLAMHLEYEVDPKSGVRHEGSRSIETLPKFAEHNGFVTRHRVKITVAMAKPGPSNAAGFNALPSNEVIIDTQTIIEQRRGSSREWIVTQVGNGARLNALGVFARNSVAPLHNILLAAIVQEKR